MISCVFRMCKGTKKLQFCSEIPGCIADDVFSDMFMFEKALLQKFTIDKNATNIGYIIFIDASIFFIRLVKYPCVAMEI